MDAGGISAIIFGLLFVLVTAAFGHKLYIDGAFSGPGPDLSFLSLLVLYFPNTLLVYGFMADIVNSRYRYSIAGITALFGMVFNKLFGGQIIAGLLQTVRGIASLIPKADVSVFDAFSKGNPLFTGTSISKGPTETTPRVPTPPPIPDVPAGPTPPAPPMRGGGTNLCSLPGFEWLENKVAPQGVIMSMTVLWYLMIELWDTGGGQQSITVSVITAVIFLVQWLVLSKNKCLDSYVFSNWSVFTSLVMSIVFAGTSYGIQKYIPYYTASRNVPPVPSGTPGTFVCPSGTLPSPSGDSCVNKLGPGGTKLTSGGLGSTQTISVGGVGEKTQAVDDNDQFVCEAYKDGELVTSTIVE